MLTIKLICVGTLKEAAMRALCDEYSKRTGAFARMQIVELKEQRLPESPSEAEITRALAAEGEAILAAIPPRSCAVALCVEGDMMSSPALADLVRRQTEQGISSLCFIIGSSYGLAPEVKARCAVRLSLSRLTFPHQLARVLLSEVIYRTMAILHGTKYHK